MINIITLQLSKNMVIDRYEAQMRSDSNYNPDEILRYLDYAKNDIGGWLGESILGLIGISQADLFEAEADGDILTIKYELR
jgi:hypothetical protein